MGDGGEGRGPRWQIRSVPCDDILWCSLPHLPPISAFCASSNLPGAGGHMVAALGNPAEAPDRQSADWWLQSEPQGAEKASTKASETRASHRMLETAGACGGWVEGVPVT